MTRDEALKTFRGATPDPSSLSDAAWIDRFVGLGMLKLDEPRSIRSRALDEILKIFGGHDADMFFKCIDDAGLKIVEASEVSDDR